MDPIIAIPIAVALCILAALCSAAEGALQALSRSEMHDIAQETTRSPQRIQAIGDEFRRHLDSLVLCQVGCLSAVGVLLALLVNEVWHRPWLAALAASVALLIVHVLFIGSFPRTVGAYRPRATVIVLSRLIRLVHAALGWVNTLRTMLGEVFISAPASTTAALASEEQLLSMVDEAAEQAAVRELLTPLREHDAQRHTSLVDTLRVVLSNDGKLVDVARSLNIHSNSLRYRIARIEEIIGGSLHDRDTRTALSLALMLEGPASNCKN